MKYKSIFPAITLIAAFLITTCLSFNDTANAPSQSTGSRDTSIARKSNEPVFKGDGGKGVVIVVPAPALQSSVRTDSWMPQLFQDLITGDLARFSAMTVIDRSNEQLILAEQTLSASGNYSDNDFIRIGNLTNAQFIVAGNIQNVSGRYNVSFRINNTETNEIKASFYKAYSINDIETGLAAKEAVLALLIGMGIELTEAGERALLAIQPLEVRATANLARGTAAGKSDDVVEALAFFSQALDSNSTRNEANRNIQSFFNDIPTGSITERANYAITQKEKWEKIFRDLRRYLNDNLGIIIYDFSTVEDRISTSGSRVVVYLKISPGIKVVTDRTVLNVWKTVMDNWEQVKKMEENRSWVNSLSSAAISVSSTQRPQTSQFYVTIGLYDEYGDIIKTATETYIYGYSNYSPSIQVIAQHKYYDDKRFKEISFSSIPAEKITNTITPKIIEVGVRSTNEHLGSWKIQSPIMMTVPEWQEWLSLQGVAR